MTQPVTLMGWTDGPASTLPPEVRRDIASGVRMAATTEGVQAELDTWRAQRDPAVWVRAWMALLLERLEALDTPADAVEALEAVDRLPEPEQPQPRAPARTGPEIQGPAAADQPGHPGSKQERAREAVRALLGTGISNREIARRVGVSPSTVAAVQKAVAESAET
jgi:ATP/maltotriose-dependent transcriptional regulator MalT